TGHLTIPSVITWQQSASPCNAPAAAWVEPGSPSKCESGTTTTMIDVLVDGQIVITKQTAPSGEPDLFAFTATGNSVSPSAFMLADTQSQIVRTAPLGAIPQASAITEAALAGWHPTAEIVCTDVLGNPASFVTIDNANRTLTATMSATNSRLFCTFINEKSGTGSITIAKTTLGGDGTFEFIGFMDFTITTMSGSGSQTFTDLAPGTYAVREPQSVHLAGWEVTDIQCTGAATPAVISLPAHSATITLAAGENVVCTFTDTKTGSITINKSTVGGDDSFRFATTGNGLSDFIIVTAGGAGAPAFNALLPRVYTVSRFTPSGRDPPPLPRT